MTNTLPSTWAPWRSPSPIGNRRPTKADLAAALDSELGREDVLPILTDETSAGLLRVLLIGINTSQWTPSVNAPFARPGILLWTALAAACITPHLVDAITR